MTPECAKDLPVPFEERRRLDDHERVAPVEEFGQGDHDEPEGGRSPAWQLLAFDIESELFSKEEVFGEESGAQGKP